MAVGPVRPRGFVQAMGTATSGGPTRPVTDRLIRDAGSSAKPVNKSTATFFHYAGTTPLVSMGIGESLNLKIVTPAKLGEWSMDANVTIDDVVGGGDGYWTASILGFGGDTNNSVASQPLLSLPCCPPLTCPAGPSNAVVLSMTFITASVTSATARWRISGIRV